MSEALDAVSSDLLDSGEGADDSLESDLPENWSTLVAASLCDAIERMEQEHSEGRESSDMELPPPSDNPGELDRTDKKVVKGFRMIKFIEHDLLRRTGSPQIAGLCYLAFLRTLHQLIDDVPGFEEPPRKSVRMDDSIIERTDSIDWDE